MGPKKKKGKALAYGDDELSNSNLPKIIFIDQT